LNVAVRDKSPRVAVTVTGYVPRAVEDEVVMFNVREQVGMQELPVANEAVAPAGRPDTVKEAV
jgi:hypothetical protein